MQAMNASEAKEMYNASLRHPGLVTQVVPSPITFEYDASIQDIVKEGILGEILYIEVSHTCTAELFRSSAAHACGPERLATAGMATLKRCKRRKSWTMAANMSSCKGCRAILHAIDTDASCAQVRALSNSFAEPDGAPLTWRTDQRYSGLNIGVLGIFYEPLQRCAQAQSCASC